MGPEAKLYKKLRKVCKKISWIRIENLSSLGTPDLLGYNTYGTFFTLELKVTKGNKVRFSPHQIAFHKKHKKNTFILVEALGQRSSKLFYLIPGSRISELVACGLRPKLDACSLELDACSLKFQNLN
jgi:Holliday junction resolvase